MAPVVIPVALAAATGAAGVALGAVTVASAILSVAATAAAAGVNYLMRTDERKAVGTPAVLSGAQSAPTASAVNAGRSITSRQAIPPRRYFYGSGKVGGVVFFQEKDNPFLYIGIAICDGEIDAIESVFINDIEVTFDALTPFAAVAGTRYFGRVFGEFALGSSTQLSSDILSGITNALYGVSTTFRQQGVARAVFKLDWGEDSEQNSALWGGGVNLIPKVRGVKMYDPREPGHVFSNRATWAYSNNPALCIAHALTQNWLDPIAFDDIDWAAVAAAADVCDATVTVLGNDYPRFTFAGVFQSESDMAEQIAEMLSAMRGYLRFYDGKYVLIADQERTSVWTVTDDDILEIGDYVHASETHLRFNQIKSVYYDSDGESERKTTPVYTHTAGVTADGGVRETSLTLAYTSSSVSAQIIAYRELITGRDGRTLSIRVSDAGMWLGIGEVITLDSDAFPFINGSFEVVQIDPAEVGCTLSLRAYVADAYASPADYITSI